MKAAPKYLIAIDGGGSTCRVAVCAGDGAVMATATGEAANPATALSDAIACIRTTLSDAQSKAGLDADAVAGSKGYIGLAGVIDPRIADAVADAMPMKQIIVTDDRPTNMAGALGARDGFLAALGTGSFLGRQKGGKQDFIGGWGFWLGDQASGAWIGRAALAAVLEWRDGLRPASPMLQALFDDFGDDPGDLVRFGKSAAPSEFASYAPRVFDAADKGDAAAMAILGDGAAYIARGLDTLGFGNGDPLCLIGGVGPRFTAFLPAGYTANLIQPQGTALDGAIQLAARMLGGAAP